MNSYSMAVIKHLVTSDNFTFGIENFDLRLNDSEEFLDSIINAPEIWASLGLYFKSSLINKPYFLGTDNFIDEAHYNKSTHRANAKIDYILFYFWFAKDNSINIDNYGALWIDEKNTAIKVVTLNQRVQYSKADASYSDSTFSKDEIIFCFNIFAKVTQISKDTNIDFGVDNHTFHASFNKIEGVLTRYNDTGRINRVMIFLKFARTTEFLPAKITFYTMIIECLFSTDDQELSHKISERFAKYLGESPSECIELFKKAKYFYSIRSKYLHGSILTAKNNKTPAREEDLALTSVELDSYIRKLLLKVITKDSELFQSNNEVLNTYFTEMIFKGTEITNSESEAVVSS